MVKELDALAKEQNIVLASLVQCRDDRSTYLQRHLRNAGSNGVRNSGDDDCEE